MALESWISQKYEGAKDLESFPEISHFGHFRREKIIDKKILVCVKHHWPWLNWIKKEKKFTPQTWCATCSFFNMVKTPKMGPKT